METSVLLSVLVILEKPHDPSHQLEFVISVGAGHIPIGLHDHQLENFEFVIVKAGHVGHHHSKLQMNI